MAISADTRSKIEKLIQDAKAVLETAEADRSVLPELHFVHGESAHRRLTDVARGLCVAAESLRRGVPREGDVSMMLDKVKVLLESEG